MGLFNMVLKVVAALVLIIISMKFFMIIASMVGESLGFSRLFEKCTARFRKGNR